MKYTEREEAQHVREASKKRRQAMLISIPMFTSAVLIFFNALDILENCSHLEKA